MSRDPEVYPEPEEFRPERFLRDGAPDPAVRDSRKFAFGFGRRCVRLPPNSDLACRAIANHRH